MNWKAVIGMKWIVLVHVISAIVGLGPTYAFPMLLRSGSSIREMERSLRQVSALELFPKLFGTIAVLSGLVLFFLGSYGSFLQVWIVGTLVLYVIVELVIILRLNPAAKKLHSRLADSLTPDETAAASPEVSALYDQVCRSHIWATVLGTIIFILMILKPH
ncbi:DUF2269 family protein [Paenibacillus ginsengarvi]|nr:DUF2269 family protein [Paenibacillus ginsengarvi]